MNNYANIPNLEGKKAIVTGANSGTGYGVTYHLAKNNCKVIMASRNQQRLEEAREKLLKEIPDAQLELEVVEITDLTSIREFCDRVNSNYDNIDFLVNNAGGGSTAFTKTADGLETVLTVNYLGHFALTALLLPVLKNASRIVTFSSAGYKTLLEDDLDIDNLMIEQASDFDEMQEYCKGKLCSVLFMVKLHEEFEKMGSSSMALSCHPGFARTNLNGQEGRSEEIKAGWTKFVEDGRAAGQNHSLYDGALPAIEALVADDAKPKVVYAPDGENELVGNPIPYEIDHTHYQDKDIDKLWVKSQELVNINVEEYL